MGNITLAAFTKERLEAYMERHQELSSKSRAVDQLISTADLVRVLELAVEALKDENERLKKIVDETTDEAGVIAK